MKKKIVVIGLLVVMLCMAQVSASALKLDEFVRKYNNNVIKESEILDLSKAKRVEYNGAVVYKAYTMNETVQVEYALDERGDIKHVGLLVTFPTFEQAGDASKALGKAIGHLVVATQPAEFTMEDYLSVMNQLITGMASGEISSVVFNGQEYQMGVQGVEGFYFAMFMYRAR